MVKKNKPDFFERSVEKISNLHITNNAIIYTRISTKDQQNGLSLDSQKAICQNYCSESGMQVIGIVAEIISAKQISNQKLLNQTIENNSNIHLVVNDASRFCRNFTDGVVILDKMIKKNIILHCAEKKMICSNNADFKTIVSDFKDAETEIVTLGNRVRRTINYKKANNTYLPSVAKYGTRHVYVIVNEKPIKKIENEPIEQKIIQLVKKMYYGGTAIEIETFLKELTGNSSHKLYDYRKEVNVQKVEYGNMRKTDIAEFLNYINIFKRGRRWTSFSIGNIL